MDRVGAVVVMSTFALIWWILGALQVQAGAWVLSAAGLIVSVVLIAIAWAGRAPAVPREEQRRRGRLVGRASAAEGAAIVAVIVVLTHLERRDLTPSAIAIVVGVHFLPLARWFPAPIYYLSAALLVLVGLASVALVDGPMRTLAVGMGAAVTLWLTCGLILRRAAPPPA